MGQNRSGHAQVTGTARGDPQGTVLKHRKKRQRKRSPGSKPPPPKCLTREGPEPGSALGSGVVSSRLPNPTDFTYTVSGLKKPGFLQEEAMEGKNACYFIGALVCSALPSLLSQV